MAYIQTPALATDSFFKVRIVHLPTSPTGKENAVSFTGWVTEFQDQFTSNWNTQNAYGRMDPLSTFENTSRAITLGFDVVSADADEAINNLLQVNRLIEFLYPVYETGHRGQQNVLKAAPLIGLQWTNLASQAADGTQLVGYLAGATYAPDTAQGGFLAGSRRSYARSTSDLRDQDDREATGIVDTAGYLEARPWETLSQDFQRNTTKEKSYIPKTLSISLNYTVLHTHLTGWYLNEAGDYVFGGDNLNGKFPNAHMVTYRKRENFTVVTSTTGSVTTPVGGEPAEFIQSAQASILRGGS
jgi:hypothetical protein